jgi:hypothetical protein
MINLKQYLITVLLFITVVCPSCKRTNKLNVEQVIAQVRSNFTPLQNRKLDFVRSIKIGSLNSQAYLYSTDEKDGKDKQELIVIENSKSNFYAIPFPSNSYRDYWNFEYDSVLSTVAHTKTTFLKEFNMAMKKLSLTNNSLVASEIFLSLLHCETIKESDSANLRSLVLTNNWNLKEEKTDSCRLRLKHNWKDIYSAMRPDEHSVYRNSFFDDANNRVYLFPVTLKEDKPQEFKVKVYRLDCIFHLMKL